MASNYSCIALLLVLLALGGCIVDAAGRTSRPLGWNSMSNPEDKLRIKIPSNLLETVSPLDPATTEKYAIKLEDRTLSQHSKEFCQDAKLACEADVAILDPTLRISLDGLVVNNNLLQQTRDLLDASRTMHFREQDIAKGSNINLPASDLSRDAAFRNAAFLPRALAQKMPFTSGRMTELLDTLNIPHDSNLAIMMRGTVGQCEAQVGKDSSRKCVTSLEDMTDFVSTSLPQALRITALDTSPSTINSKESWKVMDTKSYEYAVVCRNSMMFPYAVYQCQDISKSATRIYSVAMQARDGARVNKVAACHEEAIDNALDAGDHKGAQACQWLTHALIWAPTN